MRTIALWIASTYVLCTAIIFVYIGLIALALVLFGLFGAEHRIWMVQYAIVGEILVVIGVLMAYAVFSSDRQQEQTRGNWEMPEDFRKYYDRADQELSRLRKNVVRNGQNAL